MADCSKTVEFLREWLRMCETEEKPVAGSFCGNCQIHEKSGELLCSTWVKTNGSKALAIVQKWSDENPVMTWAGKLRELLPNANIGSIIERGCPHEYFGSVAPIPSGCCTVLCDDCWSSEYKEE